MTSSTRMRAWPRRPRCCAMSSSSGPSARAGGNRCPARRRPRMSFEYLFTPLDVGPMTVANRLVMAPMERNYANPDGTVSERTIAHYRARAAGGVGWIDVESTFVDPAGRGRTHQLGLHEDRCVDGMRALAEAVHAG